MKAIFPLLVLILASCGANNSNKINTELTDSINKKKADSLSQVSVDVVPHMEAPAPQEMEAEVPQIEEPKLKSQSEKTVENTKWVLIELNGKKISSKENNKPYFTLNSKEKTVNGYGGCNYFNGGYKLSEGFRIHFSSLMSTKKYCEVEIALEDAFLKVFEEIDNYSLYKDSLSFSKARMMPAARFVAK